MTVLTIYTENIPMVVWDLKVFHRSVLRVEWCVNPRCGTKWRTITYFGFWTDTKFYGNNESKSAVNHRWVDY